MDREQWGSFGLGVLVGSVVRGTIALLFTPKSGEETRKLIRDKVVGTATLLESKPSVLN